jgi:hypothetical protein
VRWVNLGPNHGQAHRLGDQELSGPAFPITLGDYGWSAAVTRDPPIGAASGRWALIT